MLDSFGQWNLLADCAKDWGFESARQEQAANESASLSLQEIAGSWQDYAGEAGSVPESSILNLVHCADLSIEEELRLIHELMANPKNASLWQLCLMGYSRENVAVLEENLQSPLEGIEPWILEGIRKGWLRKVEKQYAVPVLDYPLFVHRLQGECQNCGNTFTFGLVKMQTSEIVHDLFMQSLVKFLSNQDYVCKMNGLGYLLVLSGRRNFSACAVMEKIHEYFERKLQGENIPLTFTIGLTEFCQYATAETLLDEAKQALSMPSPVGMKVKSFISGQRQAANAESISGEKIFVQKGSFQRNSPKNSLVQCDEKRFLFFGVQ